MNRFFTVLRGSAQRLGLALRRPKWRHGRWSALILSAFIATCVLFNIAVETLEFEYGWRRDYSFNGYATTGEETKAVMGRLTKAVDLYLLYQSSDSNSHLLELLNRYAALNRLIHINPTDIAKNPGILTRFQGNLESVPQADSVIVSCEETGRYRILAYEDFFTLGYDIATGTFQVEGLAYEKHLTETIVYVAEDCVPQLGIVQGHGELTPAELETLIDFLRSNNYDSRTVNLAAEGALEGIDLLCIASPQRDYGERELKEIDAFARRGGSILVTRDYTDPMDMPNYFSLLRSYGVVPLSGVVIAAEEEPNSYYGERVFLVPVMCFLDITLPLIAGNLDSLLLLGSSAFREPTETDSALSVGTVLKSWPRAYLRDLSDGNTSLAQQPGDLSGELSLALYAHRMYPDGGISRLFALGSSSLLTEEFLYQRTFNQVFILQVLGELLPQKTVSLDIMASPAFRQGLRVGSHGVGLALIIVLPVLTLIIALVVLLPRRNR